MSAPSLCLVISADPRASHRPAEALRVALGLAMAEGGLRILLIGRGAGILAEDAHDLVDGDAIRRNLTLLLERGVAFHAEESALPTGALPRKIRAGSGGDLAALLLDADRSLLF